MLLDIGSVTLLEILEEDDVANFMDNMHATFISITDFILPGDIIFQINLDTQVHLSIQTAATAMLLVVVDHDQ